MAKMKDRDYYRLTLPGQLIRNLSTHHPYLVDSSGEVDDLNLVTVIANDWLNQKSNTHADFQGEISRHELPYPVISYHRLPFDVKNGPYIANVIKRNPESVVAMYVFPSDAPDDFFAYGAAAAFLGNGSKNLLEESDSIDCKYHTLVLQTCDPLRPHNNDLISGLARFSRFKALADGKLAPSEHHELYSAISSLIQYAPESTLMVLGRSEEKKIRDTLSYWTKQMLMHHVGVYSHRSKEGDGFRAVSFEY